MSRAEASRPSTIEAAELLLRETRHRSSNDLQLVVGLLTMQARRATSHEVREALSGAAERVAILAHAREAMRPDQTQSLEIALSQVRDALQSQAEPRSIQVSLEANGDCALRNANDATVIALAVNELATNAIKHAFEQAKSGHVRIAAHRQNGELIVVVDDDGLPFPDQPEERRIGLGLDLVRRMVASIDGVLIPPPPGAKIFEIRVPAGITA